MEQTEMNSQESPSAPTMRGEGELEGPQSSPLGSGKTSLKKKISEPPVAPKAQPIQVGPAHVMHTVQQLTSKDSDSDERRTSRAEFVQRFLSSISSTPLLDTSGLPQVDEPSELFTLEPTHLVNKKGKAIPINEYQHHYYGKLFKLINKLRGIFPYPLGFVPRIFENESGFEPGDLFPECKRVEPEVAAAECLDCMAYCCLFPEGYEIEGDELIQLWMAAGVVKQEPMERFAAAYLSIIQELAGGSISLTREDCMNAEKWYKLNNAGPGFSTTCSVHHLHKFVRDRPLNLDSVSTFSQTWTLLLLKGHKSSHIDRLPYGFFMSLKLLQALDLSGTTLSELPSSIGGAKFLRYLNLSETLIQRLPETICWVPNLQTLKLRNCPQLLALPQAISRVTSLRHLDLGTLCDLCSMPPQMGALTRLYTLSNFIVGRELGCSIGELKNLNNLGGRVCLSGLENVGSVDEAKEAQLLYKLNITKLELRWADRSEWDDVEGDNCEEEEVIQHLTPPKELQHLEIICYGGSKFPTWISLHWFDKLTSIFLKCGNCQLLPSLGRVPSLESLTLIELVQVKIIDLSFCVDTTIPYGDDFVAFPKLQRLEIESMLGLEEWRDMGEGHYFPRLTNLVIKDCPQLATLCKLSHANCLKYLEINCCGKLPSLPRGGLPDSVETFIIDNCPLLCVSCQYSLDEQSWHKTEHASSLLVYHHLRSCLSTSEGTSVTSAS